VHIFLLVLGPKFEKMRDMFDIFHVNIKAKSEFLESC